MIVNNQTLQTNAIGRNYTLIRVMHVSVSNEKKSNAIERQSSEREKKTNQCNDRLNFSYRFLHILITFLGTDSNVRVACNVVSQDAAKYTASYALL